MSFRFSLILLLLFTIGCSGDRDQWALNLDEVAKSVAPDKRVAIFEYEIKSDSVFVKTSEHKAVQMLQQSERLTRAKINIELLPSEKLDGNVHGIVNLSVGNIRVKPGHSEEMATQALMGTVLKVMEKTASGWYRVQTPDQYIGYADPAVFVRVNESELSEWINSNRLIFTDEYGFLYSNSSSDSDYVTDLAAGNILKLMGQKGAYYQAELPDGRSGYVSVSQVQLFNDWKLSVRANPENLVYQAKRMLGVPYLWGGTSTKGVDCSGYTKMIYLMNGIQLSRDASQQVFSGDPIPADTSDWSALQIGDLLFFGRKATDQTKERVTHVAMYMGDGKIIHSSGRVKIESLLRGDPSFNEYRYKTYLRSKRILSSVNLDGIEFINQMSLY